MIYSGTSERCAAPSPCPLPEGRGGALSCANEFGSKVSGDYFTQIVIDEFAPILLRQPLTSQSLAPPLPSGRGQGEGAVRLVSRPKGVPQ